MEKAAWLTGLALLSTYCSLRFWSLEARDAAVVNFRARQELARGASSNITTSALTAPEPDTSTWSPKRLVAYREAQRGSSSPEALLRIPALELTVPVFAGTNDANLNRGVGRIENTAAFDEFGNVGIAGHRDGFFRSLQHIHVGDEVYADTIAGTREYRVSEIKIVAPTDVSVLAPTGAVTLTLVTCYPFYYVGPAPRRFIVRAQLVTGTPGCCDGVK